MQRVLSASTEQGIAFARLRAEEIDAINSSWPLYFRCLPRSFCLWWMLHARRIASTIVIGVNVKDKNLAAHAWVEINGEPVNDRSDIASAYHAITNLGGEENS